MTEQLTADELVKEREAVLREYAHEIPAVQIECLAHEVVRLRHELINARAAAAECNELLMEAQRKGGGV